MILGGFAAGSEPGAEIRAFIRDMEQRCMDVAVILATDTTAAARIVREFGDAVVRQDVHPWASYTATEIANWWRLRGSKR